MITKKKVKETLDKLPEEFSVDDFIDRLVFVEKVERGVKNSKEGKTVSFEEAREKMEKWSV